MARSSKRDYKQRQQVRNNRRMQESAMTNRLLGAFGLCLAGLTGLFIVYRLGNRVSTIFIIHNVMWVLSAVGAAGVAAGLIFGAMKKKNGRLPGLSFYIAGISLVFALSCLLIALFHTDIVSFLYVMLPAICILYLVYHAYQREFFYVALGSGLGGLGIWVLSRIYDGPYGAAALCAGAAAVALTAVLVFVIRRNKGLLKIGSRSIRILPNQAGYLMIFLTIALIALGLLATLLFGTVAAYYSVFGIFAALFIFAVYYTVKLM